jgi:hypothetical protein
VPRSRVEVSVMAMMPRKQLQTWLQITVRRA